MFEVEGCVRRGKRLRPRSHLPTNIAGGSASSASGSLCLLALAGAFTQLAPPGAEMDVGVPLLLALSVVVVNVETPRFREPVDPFLILLAAAAVATLGQATPCASRR